MKDKKLIIIITTIIILLLIAIGMIIYTTLDSYTINYGDGGNKHVIRLKYNMVTVESDVSVECFKAPCPTQKSKHTLRFNSKNMKIVRKFIKEQFKDTNKKEINISSDQLDYDGSTIINSIIYNDETMLEDLELSNNTYIITTDMKWKTTRNDGGSYNSIYYVIDMDKNIVIKNQENYYAPDNKKENTTIYKKKIGNYEKEKLKETIDKVIGNLLLQDSDTYEFYTIKHNNSESYIYSSEAIKELESILIEIDTE